MRERHEYDTRRMRTSGTSGANAVSLHGDYAVIHGGKMKFGCVQRMVLSGQFGRKEYLLPVPYNDEKSKDITVTLTTYSQTELSAADQLEYGESMLAWKPTGETITVKHSDIFSHVNLSSHSNYYHLQKEEYNLLCQEEDKLRTANKPTTKKRAKQQTVKHKSRDGYGDDTGMVTIVVQPSVSYDGTRRSQRKRKQKKSLTSSLI